MSSVRSFRAASALAALTAAALAATSPSAAATSAQPPAAKAASAAASSAGSSASAAGEAPGQATADYYSARAMVQAKKAGKRVEVAELTTETSRTMANPDGTFELVSNARPVRVKRDGAWRAVDNTLLTRADGTIGPRSSVLGMAFSGGGTGPLVTLTRAGHSIDLTWDQRLPVPTLAGDTATYRDVLPGVDLVARADGELFTHVLVVKTPQAARHPKLAKLAFTLDGHGLRFDQAANDSQLTARTREGNPVFTTPTPTMWESGRIDTGGNRKGSPDPGAKVTPMRMKLTGNTLDITPDTALLKDPDTRYPVYIDPPWGGNKLAWAMVDKSYPTATYYNTTAEARVGYESDTGSTKRSFFRMDTSGVRGKQITAATFTAIETWAWSCTPRTVEAWSTTAFGTATTWNNQPTWNRLQEGRYVAYGWHLSGQASPCPGTNGGAVPFNVLNVVNDAAKNNWSNVTIGLKAKDETDTYAWKKFNNNPTLSVTYDSLPSVPTNLSTIPGTSCTGGVVGNTDLTLSAIPKDPDGGTVTAEFTYWKTGITPVVRTKAGTSGVAASVLISKGSLSAGTWYWKARTLSGGDSSAYTTTCTLTVDLTAPPVDVTVTSTDFPPTPDGAEPDFGTTAGSFGYLTVNGKGNPDIASYQIGINDPNPSATFKPSTAGGTVSVRLLATNEMLNHVYVRTIDKVGNPSLTVDSSFTFYAAPPTAPTDPVDKDMNSDGKADVIAILNDAHPWKGDVCLYPGSGESSTFWEGGGGCSMQIDSNRTAPMFKPIMTRWNDDAFTDVVTLEDADGNGIGETIKWFLGQGTGTYNTGGLTVTDTGTETSPEADVTGLNYTRLIPIGDYDSDNYPDLLAIDSLGDLIFLENDGYGRIKRNTDGTIGQKVGAGWTSQYAVAAGDPNGDTRPDLWRRDTGGYLWLVANNGNSNDTGPFTWTQTQKGSGWNMYSMIIPMGRWTQGNTEDIAGITPTGIFNWYNGIPTGTYLEPAVKKGTGWGMFRWVA